MARKFRTALGITALEGRDVPSTTNFFDANWYLAQNPDVAAAVQQGQFRTAEDHFRLHGDAERRSGNPLIDTQVYLDDNPDVRDAVERGFITGFRHFELHGQFERRDPSDAFQAHDYLGDYSDVAAAVQRGEMSAFEHFWRHGQFEDRLPFHGFNRTAYLEDNPDVAAAVAQGLIKAVQHYENHGRHEGRQIRTFTGIDFASGQATVTGVSQNHDDRKFYLFTAPRSGRLTVTVESPNGVFAQAEVEDSRTSIEILETEPNDGINSASGQVQAGVQYILRMRAPDDIAAQFLTRLTLT